MPTAPTSSYAPRARSLPPVLVGFCSLALLTGGPAGCTILRGPGGELEAVSLDGDKRLAPTLSTLAYAPIDENTADVFLSDLPRARFLDPRDTLADAAGSIVHIHVFLVPKAGSTPIDPTACNVTIRHLVLAGQAGGVREASDTPRMGLYAGGGFLLPDGDLGDDRAGGSLTSGSHRLTRATPGFADLLGPGALRGSFTAPLDEPLAKAMSVKLESLIRRLPPADIAEPEVKPKPKAETPKADAPKTPAKDAPKN